MNKRKFAVFDIDGTLFRWQLFHELVEELTLCESFPKGTFRIVNNAWQRWRGGEISFLQYESLIMKTLQDNLPSIDPALYDKACEAVVHKSGHKVHYYTKDLLNRLQQQDYVTIAISGSQQELLDMFADMHNFDHRIGVIYERQSNKFTGKITRSTYGNKGEILQQLIKSQGLTLENSYAIGDSESDITVLEQVENPIVFNPSEGLFNHAKQQGWNVVVERKNIVYKMENRDGLYVLEEARPY